jgi:tetratricopeptide (TPR) repeat protein
MLIREVAELIMELLIPDLKNVAIVLARTDSDEKLLGTWERLERIQLKPFTLQEITEYLELRLEQPVQEGLADAVARFTLGYPQAVGLAVDCVIEYRRDYPDLLQVFEHIPDEQAEQLRYLLSGLENAINDQYVRLALKIGAVVRYFDEGLLKYMMESWEDNPKAAELSRKYPELFEQIGKYSFVQAGASNLKYHRTVREVMDERLQLSDSKMHEELHKRAASYYEQQMLAWESARSPLTPYKWWQRYEDPVWQENMLEWQYHATAVGYTPAARLTFLRLYFDAFWWWGAYRKECELCKRLLDEWREAHNQGQKDQAALAWVQLLEELQAAYASGYQRKSRGTWTEVGMKLVQVRAGLGLDGEVDPGDEQRCYLKAMTDFFLAQAHRFENPMDDRAVRLYEEAYDLFVRSPQPDGILAAWTSYNMSDLYLERGEYDKALAKCQDTLEFSKADRLGDYVLSAHNYRVQADAHWEQGSVDNAFGFYRSAVFAAYILLGRPSPPNEEKVGVYREMVNRTLDRLESLCDDGKIDQAFQNCIILRDFWEPSSKDLRMPAERLEPGVLAAQNRREEVKRHLFPPEPGPEQYGKEESEFVQSVNWMFHNKGGTV